MTLSRVTWEWLTTHSRVTYEWENVCVKLQTNDPFYDMKKMDLYHPGNDAELGHEGQQHGPSTQSSIKLQIDDSAPLTTLNTHIHTTGPNSVANSWKFWYGRR